MEINITITDYGNLTTKEQMDNIKSLEHLKALTRSLYARYRVIETAIKSGQKTRGKWIVKELDASKETLSMLYEKHNGLKKYNTPPERRKKK